MCNPGGLLWKIKKKKRCITRLSNVEMKAEISVKAKP